LREGLLNPINAAAAGSNNKSAYFHQRNGYATVLRIDGKKVTKVTKVGEVELGGLPEGAAFTPDGKYLVVGNYLDQDLSIRYRQAVQAAGPPGLDPDERALTPVRPRPDPAPDSAAGASTPHPLRH
jgi:DNA-binding beta-propeller fold protein YncE